MLNALQRARAMAQAPAGPGIPTASSTRSPAALAMMIAAAKLKSDANSQSVADDFNRRASKSKVSVNIGADGRQTLTTRNVPLDDVEAETAEAAEAPFREVADTLSRENAADLQELRTGLDRDAIRKELSTHEGRVRVSMSLGATSREWAEHESRLIAKGKVPLEDAVELVFKKRESQATKLLSAIESQAGKVAHQRESARNKIDKSDLQSLTTQDVAVRSGMDPAAVEGDPVLTDAMSRQRTDLTIKKAREAAGVRRKAVADMKKDVVESGQSFGDWLGDTEAQAGELTPSERSRAQSKWKAFERSVAKSDTVAVRAQEDQRFQRERQDAFLKKLSEGTPDKPTKITAAEAKEIDIDDLLEFPGRKDIDQQTVETAFRIRKGRIMSELGGLEAKRAKKRQLVANASLDPDVGEADIEEMTTRINQLREEKTKIESRGGKQKKDSLGIR